MILTTHAPEDLRLHRADTNQQRCHGDGIGNKLKKRSRETKVTRLSLVIRGGSMTLE